MLRAAVNVSGNVHEIMEEKSSNAGSRTERLMNLSSNWGNYGQVLRIQGKQSQALDAVYKSLKYSYLGGHSNNFLVALQNIIHFQLQIENIRGAIVLAEAGIKISDRTGAVQSSIELRTFLAAYTLCRHESRMAEKHLQQAKRLAVATNDLKDVLLCRSLHGQVLLKRNEFTEGLTAIADVISETPNVAFVMLPYSELTGYLHVFDIPTQAPCFITLTHADIAGHVSRIKNDIEEAIAQKRLPWKGAHCAVYKSAGIDEEDIKCLFQAGLYVFNGDDGRAIPHSLSHIMTLLNRNELQDALWWVSELLERPNLPGGYLAHASACAAMANAGLGNLEAANHQFATALKIFQDIGEEMPLAAAQPGFWFYVQYGDITEALHWVKLLAAALEKSSQKEELQLVFLMHIRSHGARLEHIASAYMIQLSMDSNSIMEADKLFVGPAPPYLHYRGINEKAYESFSPKALVVVEKAKAAIINKKEDEALKLLHKLSNIYKKGMTIYQLDTFLDLQIEAMLITKNIQEVSRKLEAVRELFLNQLNFSSLALLETLIIWKAVQINQIEFAAEILSTYSFIDELVTDPFVKARFRCWSIIIGFVRNKNRNYGSRETMSMKLAEFFRIPELDFIKRLTAHEETPEEEDRGLEIVNAFAASLQNTMGVRQVNVAVRQTLSKLKEARIDNLFYQSAIYDVAGKWALSKKFFSYAIKQYRISEKISRQNNDRGNWLNAMAGAGRALSRNKNYQEAILIFEKAIIEANGHTLLPNLLSGLAATHMIEATERYKNVVIELIDKAIEIYKKMIDASKIGSIDRAYAKLGIARAYGQKGEQELALRTFDQGVAELAHLGAPSAKILLENRQVFEDGNWFMLGLT